MSTHTIEVLSFEGCPHADLALRRAHEAVRASGLEVEVVSIVVDGAEDAIAKKFLGSPSIRVNGIDVDAPAESETEYGLRCRVYSTHDGHLEGAPSVERIVAALRGESRVFVCTLPPAELRQRRVEVLAGVRRRVSRIDETPDGFVFTFSRSPELLAELDEFLRFEAHCCSFIRMTLVEVGNEIELRMSAPEGAKPFIRHELIDLPAAVPTKPSCCGG
jgi:hypothetical protein